MFSYLIAGRLAVFSVGLCCSALSHAQIITLACTGETTMWHSDNTTSGPSPFSREFRIAANPGAPRLGTGNGPASRLPFINGTRSGDRFVFRFGTESSWQSESDTIEINTATGEFLKTWYHSTSARSASRSYHAEHVTVGKCRRVQAAVHYRDFYAFPSEGTYITQRGDIWQVFAMEDGMVPPSSAGQVATASYRLVSRDALWTVLFDQARNLYFAIPTQGGGRVSQVKVGENGEWQAGPVAS
jgi:hypothetical protein